MTENEKKALDAGLDLLDGVDKRPIYIKVSDATVTMVVRSRDGDCDISLELSPHQVTDLCSALLHAKDHAVIRAANRDKCVVCGKRSHAGVGRCSTHHGPRVAFLDF